MTAERSNAEEPRLTIRGPSRRLSLRSRALRSLLTALAFPVAGLLALTAGGHLLLPFDGVTTLEGKIASKSEFFEDEKVQRILMKHGIKVHITRMGSRDIATTGFDGYDFAFPSGQPAADMIKNDRRDDYAKSHQPFVSPIVLATYREYAETLRDNGLATPREGVGADGRSPLYYTLNMKGFIDLSARGRKWSDIGIEEHRTRNGNRILAQTSNVCEANHAGTYLGLVAFVENGNTVPTDNSAADRVAAKIKPTLVSQGLASEQMFKTYEVPEGKGVAPIVVVYEHQYFAYQIRQRQQTGKPDSQRVLLYPSTQFLTEPEYIALTPKGDRLGELLASDEQLQRRAMELGFRVLDSSNKATSTELYRFLEDQGIPAPASAANDTKATLPSLPLLERMITSVGDCPPPKQSPESSS
ncbi:hypothetical protein GTZ78_43300 [Streptomyces sp. SID8361]|uniref:hypothetical protein n=1 Tax=Streptomyces TaxID=1883 RepID=UPI00081F0255|nr:MULTISPECIES: hypothetical protein [unclassified Streptomyces]MCM3805468.1 hypothetical protein [Streptomyces sp. DR7-3]MYU17337.1 hypothetical protein [Streptomyces sp. SID8361]SCG11891.1 hypothetical protein GA0115260_115712 [Streptomyces sp. MnatMP-M27]